MNNMFTTSWTSGARKCYALVSNRGWRFHHCREKRLRSEDTAVTRHNVLVLMDRRQLRKLELMSATILPVKIELARSGMLLFPNERENRVKTPREDLLERLLVNIPKAQASLSAEINRQIVAHTAPPIHALCQDLQEHLPRELRDMVYEHLLPPCDILIEATDFLPLDDIESSRPRLISFPHLL